MTAEALLFTCKARGLMVVTAESCTGGLIAGKITDIAGSSAIFDRGFVTYTNEAKRELLNVPYEILNDHGAVSEEVAAAMASGALSYSAAQLAVSVTGIAGPGGSEHKPEGRVCFGLATSAGVTASTVEFGPLGRRGVRAATVNHAIGLLLEAALLERPNIDQTAP